MKLVWLTDIHLNFLEFEERNIFYHKIINACSDAILITGDIAEAPSVGSILKEMIDFIKKPIYFVLGNHDYYKSDIKTVRKQMNSLSKNEPLLRWLPATGAQQLNKNVILLGQDGWADGRFGDYYNSPVSLVDSRLITDLFQKKILGKKQLLEKMQELADNDAKDLQYNLKKAIDKNPKKIIILSHVPPFKETALYDGKISDDNFQPFFTSKTTGEVLMNISSNFPTIDFLVLCGHTHHECMYRPLDNLTIKVGKAEYYHPEIQEILKI